MKRWNWLGLLSLCVVAQLGMSSAALAQLTLPTEPRPTEPDPADPGLDEPEAGIEEVLNEATEEILDGEESAEPEEEYVPPEPRPYAPLRPRITCPTEVNELSALMLRDIPNYTNRVLQRTVAVLPWTEADELRVAAGELVRSQYRPSHVLIAGEGNLSPLDLSDYTYTTSAEAGGPLTQVFFTTLSRQYPQSTIEQLRSGSSANEATVRTDSLGAREVQEYHWLFLTQTTGGWRLAFMFSSIDDAQSLRSPLPPRENSQGTVGQAVQLWLRDCRAGAIYELR